MAFWLFKSEPDVFGWDDLVAKGEAGEEWNGVRSLQARNIMRRMTVGDRGFFYHSNIGKAVVGIVEVIAPAHPDSTADDPKWECVDIAAVRPLLDAMAANAPVVGPLPGDGQKFKIVNQLLCGVHIAAAGEALALAESEYDLVLIDCPPSLNALTHTGWAASDRVAIVTEPGLFSVAAADRALRAIDELRRALSPRLQPLGIIVNRARMQSVEHQFRVRELRDMFGPLVIPPFLPERTALQQAQGAAKPVHLWPGESAEEMAEHFDRILDRVLRIGKLVR